MDFDFFCELCFNLKNNSKKLLKTQLISDYLSTCSDNDSMLVCDILSGNFAREISKKELGISIKSVFEVLSSYYMVSRVQIEDYFNDSGDIFKTVENLELDFSSKILAQRGSLNIQILVQTLKEISLISGKNSNTYKKNKLLSLFSLTQSLKERQILTAFLSDLLKIGVNEGLLHDAFILSYFPKIEFFYQYEPTINRYIINLEILETYLDLYGSENCNLLRQNFKLSSNVSNVDKYVHVNISELGNLRFNDIQVSDGVQENGSESLNLKSLFELCLNKGFDFPFSNTVITMGSQEEVPYRLMYNEFKNLFDSFYAFNVSYAISFNKLKENMLNLFNPPIIFNKPIKVMLGPRLYSFNEVEEKLDFPLFCDYKYDGLRLIIQNNFGNVTLFSRNLENLTTQFPEIVSFMKENFSKISCVLDCECVGFDKYSFIQVEFQELSKRIMTKSHNLKSNIILGIRVFDILEYEGRFVHVENLELRQDLMRNLFKNSQIIISKKRSSKDVIGSLSQFFEKVTN